MGGLGSMLLDIIWGCEFFWEDLWGGWDVFGAGLLVISILERFRWVSFGKGSGS